VLAGLREASERPSSGAGNPVPVAESEQLIGVLAPFAGRQASSSPSLAPAQRASGLRFLLALPPTLRIPR
jgi:hypothetical protein